MQEEVYWSAILAFFDAKEARFVTAALENVFYWA